jgi:hypothetical protein
MAITLTLITSISSRDYLVLIMLRRMMSISGFDAVK